MRATIYLTEAFNDVKNIVGLQCESFDIFNSGGCNSNRLHRLVNEDIKAVGDYYFSTQDKPPFIVFRFPKVFRKKEKLNA